MSIQKCIGSIMGMLRLIGVHPVVYFGENQGALLRHVTPNKFEVDTISSHGSKKDFGPHVDNPDLPLFDHFSIPSVISPDVLSLFCVRQDLHVPTDVILLDDVIANMDPSLVETLRMPIYNIQRPDSFGNSKDNVTLNKPIIELDNCGNYVSRFDIHRVSSSYQIGKHALAVFSKEAMNPDILKSFYLSQGDFLIFKNKRVLHSRRAFQPKFDASDRWLMRVFGLYKQPKEEILLNSCDISHLNTDLSAYNQNDNLCMEAY